MSTVLQIYEAIDRLAPFSAAEYLQTSGEILSLIGSFYL